MTNMIYPNHLQIETVAGFCPSRCTMCPIEDSPRHAIMTNEVFQNLLERFRPYREHLRFTTLVGLGETLLDKGIVGKVRTAKRLGFPSVGFATVAVNLDDRLTTELLAAGLDTIIFSVDGLCAETHEAIRKGTDFASIVRNIEHFIVQRNATGKTKIILRMIRQDSNRDEWDDYRAHWSAQLNPHFGDQVSGFEVCNLGQTEHVEDQIRAVAAKHPLICSDLYERFLVNVDGSVGFCCGDAMDWFTLGNVLHEDPITIYNRGEFVRHRAAMQAGQITELEHCRNCSIILSQIHKEYLDVDPTVQGDLSSTV